MKHVIYPYLSGRLWVFDDRATGLKAEPFVTGSSEALSMLVEAKQIPNADKGFALTFADEPFADADAQLHWVHADDADAPMPGNTYQGQIGGQWIEGWLCPALLLYFSAPPKSLHILAAPLPAGIDPIGQIAPDDPRQRRFMTPDDA